MDARRNPPRDARLSSKDLVQVSQAELDSLVAKAVKMAHDLFEKKLEEVKQQCNRQQTEIHLLQDQLRAKDREINTLEQYSRRTHVRIFGLDATAANCKETVSKFLTDNLNTSTDSELIIQPEDIDAAHPLPSRRQPTADATTGGSTKPPPIIVRFFSREKRDAVISRRRLLKTRNVNVSIQDDLTRRNAALLTRVRNSKKYHACWSWLGKIYVKKEESSSPQRIDIDHEL